MGAISSRFILNSLDSTLIDDKEWLALLFDLDRELFDDLFVPILNAALKHRGQDERDKWYCAHLGLVVTPEDAELDTDSAPHLGIMVRGRSKPLSRRIQSERQAAELMIGVVVRVSISLILSLNLSF